MFPKHEAGSRLAALPVTDVGKPYKLGLRADARQGAVAGALAHIDGVQEVSAAITDREVAVTIETDRDPDHAAESLWARAFWSVSPRCCMQLL
ncbi:hypothetical protein [Nocardia asiatica]|uniref:hypothetical protein n=1 Tax=Nocardia asiatica TaxID=209252 RepID=UPI003EDFD553